MARRYYSSTAVETTLSGSISNSATSITVTALSGFPNTTPWTAILDEGTASEELVEVTNVAGTTLTVTRGVDGTAAVAHNAGASFKHGVSGRDFDEANSHVNASSGVHGRTGAVVGTTDSQTLTNKTITYTDNTLTGVAPSSNPTFTGVASFPDGSASDPSITNTGDTNTGLYFADADTIAVTTGGTARLRVNSSGNVGIGEPANIGSKVHIMLETTSTDLLRLDQFADTNNPGKMRFRKGRGTDASPVIVNSGDSIGEIAFSSYDGSSRNTEAARIIAQVDGTPGANDMPGRLGFYTTADGSATPTERLRIDSNGLITGTGTSLGAWTTYTPTLGGTGWAIGNGTASGWYCQIGKVVHIRVVIVLGSTSTFGSVSPTVSLPLSSVTNANGQQAQNVFSEFLDSSAGTRYRGAAFMGGGVITADSLSTAGVHNATNSTTPFTWASSDEVRLSATYETTA